MITPWCTTLARSMGCVVMEDACPLNLDRGLHGPPASASPVTSRTELDGDRDFRLRRREAGGAYVDAVGAGQRDRRAGTRRGLRWPPRAARRSLAACTTILADGIARAVASCTVPRSDPAGFWRRAARRSRIVKACHANILFEQEFLHQLLRFRDARSGDRELLEISLQREITTRGRRPASHPQQRWDACPAIGAIRSQSDQG